MPGRRRRPQRSPLPRPLGGWATVRARLDDTHYEIMMESRVSMPTVGFYSGAHVLLPGERVLATWRAEARLWHIQGVGTPSGVAGAPVAYQPAVSADDGWWDSLNPATFSSGADRINLQDSGGLGGGFLNRGFVRFPAVNVAQAATISVATLDATQGANFTASIFIDVFGDDSDDAVAPTTGAGANGKTRTTAVLANVATSTWPGSAGVEFEVGDVTSIIQEIVDRPGWSSGNAMQIFFDTIDNGGVLLTRHLRAEEHAQEPVTLNIATAAPAIPTEQLQSTDLSDFEEI